MTNNKIEVSFKLEDIPMIIETLEKIQNENKQLKEKINKAIEYIKENYTNEDGTCWHEGFKPILEILGDKEDNTITLNTKDMNITGGKYER